MSDERASASAPEGFEIESATPADRLDILRVLDAAMLETDAETVDAAIDACTSDADTAPDPGDAPDADTAPDADSALVARFKRTDAVVGALVATRPEADRLHVDAVAVRRARRGRGVGSALVAAAVRRAEGDAGVEVVTARFDPTLESFYTDLGFDIVDRDDRLQGAKRVDGGPG